MTLTEPVTLSYTTGSSNVTCNGANDGTITLSASGGTTAYQYSIDGGASFQASGSFTGLSNGIYNIVVEDANNCQKTSSITLTEPTQFSYTTNSTDLLCNGNSSGSVILTASGGVTPYQYSINGGASSQASGSFTGLSAATYNVVVEDANNCQETSSVTLIEPAALTHSNALTNLTCKSSGDGSIDLFASGGTPAYQYSINGGVNFQSSNTFNSLSAGTYNCIVEDVSGCQSIETISLTEPYRNNFINRACGINTYY